MTATKHRSFRASRRNERGSAYIISLLVLLALTVIGLSLALTTGSEIEIGANERMANRVFYAADAGVGEAATRLIFSNDNRPRTFTLMDPGSTLVGVRVEVTPFHAINDAPSNLSEINQGSEFLKITYAVNTTATRFGKLSGGGGDVVLAQKRLGVMLDIDPQQPSTDLLRYIGTSELDNIKF